MIEKIKSPRPDFDSRLNRQTPLYDLKNRKMHFVANLEDIQMDRSNILFETPNLISLLMSISKKSELKAKEIFYHNIKEKFKKTTKYHFEFREVSTIYDYLEEVKISVVFAYNSIEAFVNISIPEDYVYEVINNKGIKETWNKSAIQKWLSTSEKLTKILPKIKSTDSPSQEKFWVNFKNLEEIRNSIIHPKPIQLDINNRLDIHKSFFDEKIFRYINSHIEILNFFCNQEFAENFYPITIGSKYVKPLEIDDYNETYEIDDDL